MTHCGNCYFEGEGPKICMPYITEGQSSKKKGHPQVGLGTISITMELLLV